MTIPGMWGVEHYGRRNLLIYGAAWMTICEFLVAIKKRLVLVVLPGGACVRVGRRDVDGPGGVCVDAHDVFEVDVAFDFPVNDCGGVCLGNQGFDFCELGGLD